jgi:hypothetical protein
MRDWLRDAVEPCLLVREIEVARDMVAASLLNIVAQEERFNEVLNFGLLYYGIYGIYQAVDVIQNTFLEVRYLVTRTGMSQNIVTPLCKPYLLSNSSRFIFEGLRDQHELRNTEHRYFPWRDARLVYTFSFRRLLIFVKLV